MCPKPGFESDNWSTEEQKVNPITSLTVLSKTCSKQAVIENQSFVHHTWIRLFLKCTSILSESGYHNGPTWRPAWHSDVNFTASRPQHQHTEGLSQVQDALNSTQRPANLKCLRKSKMDQAPGPTYPWDLNVVPGSCCSLAIVVILRLSQQIKISVRLSPSSQMTNLTGQHGGSTGHLHANTGIPCRHQLRS